MQDCWRSCWCYWGGPEVRCYPAPWWWRAAKLVWVHQSYRKPQSPRWMEMPRCHYHCFHQSCPYHPSHLGQSYWMKETYYGVVLIKSVFIIHAFKMSLTHQRQTFFDFFLSSVGVGRLRLGPSLGCTSPLDDTCMPKE